MYYMSNLNIDNQSVMFCKLIDCIFSLDIYFMLAINFSGFSIDYNGETVLFEQECEKFMKPFVESIFSERYIFNMMLI